MKRLGLLALCPLLFFPLAAHATVTGTTNSVSFTCSGSAGPFPFQFGISDPTALDVIQNGTILLSSAYAIAPVNNNYDNGGKVTLVTACTTGTLVLQRNTPVNQLSIFRDNMPIPMATIENGLDKLTEIDQDIQNKTWGCPAGQFFNAYSWIAGPYCQPGGGSGPPSNLVYNVKDYGATGNGTTDDTAAIMRAIAAAMSTGGIVFFPQGNYITSGSGLALNYANSTATRINLVGAGVGSSSITYSGSGDAIDVFSNPFTINRGGLITGLTIGCSGSGTSAVHISGVIGYTLRDLTLQNCSGTSTSAGLWLDNQALPAASWTEETNVDHVNGLANSIDFRLTDTSGNNSMGYSDLTLYCGMDAAVANETCFQTENDIFLYHGRLFIRANANAPGHTIIKMLGSSNIGSVNDSLGVDATVFAETTGSPATYTSFNLARGTQFYVDGNVDMVQGIPVDANTPGAILVHHYWFDDSIAQLSNFQGTGNTATFGSSMTAAVDNRYANIGFINGPGLLSSWSSFYSGAAGNGFYVYGMPLDGASTPAAWTQEASFQHGVASVSGSFQVCNAGAGLCGNYSVMSANSPPNGTLWYCPDCNSTCSAGSFSGQMCQRSAGEWVGSASSQLTNAAGSLANFQGTGNTGTFGVSLTGSPSNQYNNIGFINGTNIQSTFGSFYSGQPGNGFAVYGIPFGDAVNPSLWQQIAFFNNSLATFGVPVSAPQGLVGVTITGNSFAGNTIITNQAGASNIAVGGPSLPGFIVTTPTTLPTSGCAVWGTDGLDSTGVDCGGGGGAGSVTNFASTATVGTLLTTAVANPTTTPSQTIALTNAAANSWWGNATSGATTPVYNAFPLPPSYVTPPPSAYGIQYVGASGNDSNDGLTWQTAKLTVYAALESLPGGSASAPITSGHGTVYVGPLVSVGAADGKGLRLVGAGSTEYASPATGWMKYGAGGLTLSCVNGNSAAGNSHAPACLESWGSSASYPAVQLNGNAQALSFNNFIFQYQGTAITMGIDSTGNRNNGGSQNVHFSGISGSGGSSAMGYGPQVDIGSNVFWAYFDDDVFYGSCDVWAASLVRSSNVVTGTIVPAWPCNNSTHDLTTGAHVSIRNELGDTSFNGTYTVTSTPTTSTFTLAQTGPSVALASGPIVAAVPHSGSAGTGWTTGNVATITGCGPTTNATMIVTASAGAVTSLALPTGIAGGAGYSSFSNCTATGAGTGLTVDITIGAAVYSDKSFSITVNPGSGSGSGLIFVNRMVGNGIKFYNGANGGSITDTAHTEEGTGGIADTPGLWLACGTTNTPCGGYANHIEIADSGRNATPFVVDQGASPEAIYADFLFGGNATCLHDGPMTLGGALIYASSPPCPNLGMDAASTPFRSGGRGVVNGLLAGQTDSARRGFSPVATRFTNLAGFANSSWTVNNFTGGTLTTTTGVASPDGTSQAVTYSLSGGSGTANVAFKNSSSITSAVGDFYIFGVWVQATSGTGYAGGGVGSLTFFFQGSNNVANTYYQRPPSGQSDGQWEWVWGVAKVTEVTTNPATVSMISSFNNVSSLSVYAPVLIHVASGAISDNEAYETALQLRSYRSDALVGQASVLPGQQLMADSAQLGYTAESFVVGGGGVVQNTLVQTDNSNPSEIITSTTEVYGIATMSGSAASMVPIARYGTYPCSTDTGGATVGDLVIIGTGTINYCKDSGQTNSAAIPSTSRIVGVFRSTAVAGATALVELTPAHFGTNISSPLTTEGDLYYFHSAANARLPVGSNGNCLTSNGTDPLWGSCSTGSGTVITTGSPTNYQTPVFTGALSITGVGPGTLGSLWTSIGGGGPPVFQAPAEINSASYVTPDPNYGTDDTAALQNLLNACGAPGCTIVMQPGQYKVTSTLTHTGIGLHIRAAGAAGGGPGTGGPQLGTVSIGCFTANIPALKLGSVTTANYAGGSIEGITFVDKTGGNTCAGGIESINQSYFDFKNNGFSGFSEAATVAPTTPALTPSTTGGSLANATYYVAISDTDANGRETLTGTAVSTAVGGSGAGSIAVASHSSASPMTCYNVYLGASATTLHLVKQCATSGSGFTVMATAATNVGPLAFDESKGFGILSIGTAGGLGTLSGGYVNQNLYIGNQVYNSTLNGIVFDRNSAEPFMAGGNIYGSSNTSGCGLIASGNPFIFQHTEAGGTGWKRACITGPMGEIHLSMDLGSGTQTGIQAINAWHWTIYGTCAAGGTQTLVNLDATSNFNEVHAQDNTTCTNPLIVDAGSQALKIDSEASQANIKTATALAANPSVCSGTQLPNGILASGAAANCTSQPVGVGFFFPGVPIGSQLLMQIPFTTAVSFPLNLAGSVGVSSVAATASTIISFSKNGASAFGTCTFAISGTTCTFSATATSFASGDILTATAPASPDATLANISITFAGTR